MSSVRKRTKKGKSKQAKTDLRKQVFNEGKIGPIEKIQVSTERIVQLNGIVFDLDLDLIRAGGILDNVPKTAECFYRQHVSQWLERHTTLNKAEVIMTGNGLHVILWTDEPIKFLEPGDRERWAAKVQVIQAALPIDPFQPGITATTRALGSINSKNGKKVRRLKTKEPVTQQELAEFADEIVASPFKSVMKILTGTDRLQPCPKCKQDDATLSALDHVGKCYGSCGTLKLEDLYGLVLCPNKKGAE
jgi:hypothetical protein